MAISVESGSVETHPGSDRRLPLWKKALFSTVVLLIVFGLPELILSWLDYPPPVSGIDRSPEIFWGLEKNLSNHPFYHKEVGSHFKVSTNSRSLRYKEIPLGRQPDVVRVLALGDSTTFGWGVEQDEMYPAQLEGLLQAAHPGIAIQVLNGGVPGYTSFQGLHHFKSNAAAYEPDIVLFGYIVQDARKTAITDKQQAIKAFKVRSLEILQKNPFYRLRTVRVARDRYEWMRSYLRDRASQDGEKVSSSMTRVPLEDYRENILTFAKLCEEQNARLVLFGFPLEVIGYTAEHRKLLKQMAQEHGLSYFDPSNDIHTAAMRETLYFPEDKGHPNARGCTVIAEKVAEFIEQEQLLAKPIADRQSARGD